MFSLPFSKKSGLLYIRRDKAQLYQIGASSSIEVVFDKAVFENLEVKDKEAFKFSLKEVIQKVGEKNLSILIVLSSDIVFRKDLPKLSDGELDLEVKKFIDAIPMDNDRLDYRIMPVESGVAVVATNSLIYNLARDAIESSGLDVEAIVPSAFFGVTSTDITLNVFAQISKSKVSFGETDFMRKGEKGKVVPNPITSISALSSESSPFVETTTTSNKKNLLLILLIVVLFGTAGFILKKYYFSSEDPKPEVSEVVEDLPVVESIPEEPSIEEPTILIEKVDLRFEVLNSTKVSGLAGKVKDELTDFDYSNIQVGNSSEVLENTQMILYKQVPEEYITEITDSLKSVLSVEVIDVVEDFKEVYDFDIQIIIAGVK